MQVSLVMFKADGTRQEFPLQHERVVVGRKNNCDLRIPLSSVSRQHCEITLEGDEIAIRDLGSSNGTYHNHIRVQEATLQAGDEVVIGPVVFTVVVDGQPEQIEPVRTVVDGSTEETSSLEGVDFPDEPEAIQTNQEDGDTLPDVEPEFASPTVDLEDDPIAALERMAEAEQTDGAESDLDEDLDLEIELDEDEDDRRQP